MALMRLGQFIEQSDDRNIEGVFGEEAVVGLSTQKVIIHTKADLSGVNLSSYKLFPPHYFAYVPDTSRRGDKMSMAYNMTCDTFLVSSISCVFFVKETGRLDPVYLYMYFNRPEYDRYTRFNSWGSARETFSWEEMCSMEIDIPPLEIQQKYVDVYLSMLENQRSYERGLDDLKLTCDALLEKFKHDTRRVPLGNLVEESDIRNEDGIIVSVQGVNKEKQFMPSVASGADLTKYKTVGRDQFACNLMHVGRDVAVPISLNNSDESLIVSPAYLVFSIKSDIILPEYALMWMSRNETDRYAWFVSDTNVRSGMEKKRFYEIDIPVPTIEEQQSLVDIFHALSMRRNINERMKAQIKCICPILIKGSLEEGDETTK